MVHLDARQRMKAAVRKNTTKVESSAGHHGSRTVRDAADAPGGAGPERRYVLHISQLYMPFRECLFIYVAAMAFAAHIRWRGGLTVLFASTCFRRMEKPQVTPAAAHMSPAGKAMGASRTSTPTPVRITEMESDHSGNARASLGGLGADSNWGGVGSGGDANSRCAILTYSHELKILSQQV